MARGQLPPTSLARQSLAHRTAAREAAMSNMRELLGRKAMTTLELFKALGLNRSTGFAYLRKLHRQGVVHMLDEKRDGLVLWALGADSKLADSDDEIDAAMELKRYVAQASQIGMWRDPLVAALFGPARGAAA